MRGSQLRGRGCLRGGGGMVWQGRARVEGGSVVSAEDMGRGRLSYQMYGPHLWRAMEGHQRELEGCSYKLEGCSHELEGRSVVEWRV